MIDINDLFNVVNDLASKNNGQYISPQEFNRYAPMASRDLFDKLIGRKDMPRTGYGKNRTLDSRLNPYKVRTTLTLVNGVTPLPTGWEKTNAVYLPNSMVVVEQTDEDRLARIMDSPIDQPTLEYPVFIETTDLRVYPQTITQVTIEYLKAPVPPVWDYTLDGRRPIYNASTSTQLEWSANQTFELATRILNYLGISMKDASLINYTENKQAQE